MSDTDVALQDTMDSERSKDRSGSPVLGRKSMLMGLLTSGFVAANVARSSSAQAATVKPTVAAVLPNYVARWTPATAYTLGQQLISPTNDVVCAKVAHTSSAAYATDTARWTVSSTFGTRGSDWVTARAYVVGELVVSTGVIYRVKTAHTSASTFDGTKFLAISGGGPKRTETIWVDDMGGANDDDKLAAALAFAGAQSCPPAIRFGNREYLLARGGLTPFHGMTLWGPDGYNNPERGGYTCGTRIKLTMNGGWFVNSSSSDTFGVSFGNLSFVGGSGATVIAQAPGAASMYCLLMRDISSSGLKSVLGTQSAKLLITAASFDGGAWEINNCYSGAFHLGGSDNTLWPDGCLLDSGTAFNAAGNSAGQYHLWCDSLDKTYIGPMYITCEGGWGGIKVTGTSYNSGSNNAGVVNIHGARIEGRNPTHPCNGANIRVEGGHATLNDCWIAYGMSSPATMGHSPTDAGVIHQSGGRLILRGGVYDHTGGQSETVPFIYSSGGSTRVRDLSIASHGGVWSGLPRVRANGGNVTVDDTATRI